jgi:hypothetical protein
MTRIIGFHETVSSAEFLPYGRQRINEIFQMPEPVVEMARTPRPSSYLYQKSCIAVLANSALTVESVSFDGVISRAGSIK